MSLVLHVERSVQTRAEPTDGAMQVAVMFGLPLDARYEHVVVPPIDVPLSPGQIVFVTGVSGGGKSTLLRLIKQKLIDHSNGPALIDADALPQLPDTTLVDALALPEEQADQPNPTNQPASLNEVCRWLSLAGLNDAAVMLRKPSELSVGQRYRLRLAQAIAASQRCEASCCVLLADEFCSSLDRTTARAIAHAARRWVSQSNACLVAATAHDDLLEPLAPDVLIEFSPGGGCEVHTRSA